MLIDSIKDAMVDVGYFADVVFPLCCLSVATLIAHAHHAYHTRPAESLHRVPRAKEMPGPKPEEVGALFLVQAQEAAS